MSAPIAAASRRRASRTDVNANVRFRPKADTIKSVGHLGAGGYMRILATVILCLGFFAGAFASDPKVTNTQRALDRLVAHPDRDDRFVIVDHLSSEKFVQFDFEDDEVVIDLPILALVGAEQERAAVLFASVWVRRPSMVTEASEAGEAPTFATYRLGFGKNSASAAAFAARVFKEVYLLPPDARFVVTEGE